MPVQIFSLLFVPLYTEIKFPLMCRKAEISVFMQTDWWLMGQLGQSWPGSVTNDHQRQVTKAEDVTAALLSWCPPSILCIYIIGTTLPGTFSFYISGSYAAPGVSQHGHFTLINRHVIGHWTLVIFFFYTICVDVLIILSPLPCSNLMKGGSSGMLLKQVGEFMMCVQFGISR